MTETRSPHLDLAYLAPAQAQKHVTINEAFRRLDWLVHLTIIASDNPLPPDDASEGDCYIIPLRAAGVWSDQENQIAIYQDGGWYFALARIGWRAFDSKAGKFIVFDGTDWVADATDAGGAPLGVAQGMRFERLAATHNVVAGSSNTTGLIIPARALLFGVTARVTQAILGARNWRLGVANGLNRFGNGLGTALGSTAEGPSSPPIVYWADTPIRITAGGDNFSGGQIALALFVLRMDVPPSA